MVQFTNLGYHVNPATGPVSRGAKALVRWHFNQYAGYLPRGRHENLYRRCDFVLAKLCATAGLPANTLRLTAVEDKEPNAVIFKKTGDIFITTGLLEKDAISEGELAAALSHEIGHYLKGLGPTKIPGQFKNQMFREFFYASEMAKQQMEEYSVDELGLVLMDLSGYAVAEAESMSAWLKTSGTSAAAVSDERRILSPGSTHPNFGARHAIIQGLLDNPIFKWKNRQAESAPLFPIAFNQQLLHREKPDTLTVLEEKSQKNLAFDFKEDALEKLAKDHDPLEIETLFFLSESYSLGPHPIVFFLGLINEAEAFPDNPKLLPLFKDLEREINNGNHLALSYRQALIAYLVLGRMELGLENTQAVIDFLTHSCQLNMEAIAAAVLFTLNALADRAYDINLYRIFEERSISLDVITRIFAPSQIRDQIILGLLRWEDLVDEQWQYLDVRGRVRGAMFVHEQDFSLSGIIKLARIMVSPAFFGELTDSIENTLEDQPNLVNRKVFDLFKNEHQDAYSSSCVLLGDSTDLMTLFQRTCWLGLPFSPADLEAELAKSLEFLLFCAYPSPKLPEDIVKFFKLAKKLTKLYEQEPLVQKRAQEFIYTVILRYLEALQIWERPIIKEILALPACSQKNQLLIMLYQAGKIGPLDQSAFLFEEIPRPEQQDGQLTLLNAFGFSAFQAEAVYPSGQRCLDRFLAEALPAKGPLKLKAVIELIPRPSPFRDDLLLRCAETESLEHFWSPAAAFAQAYQLARDLDGLEKICEITREFPSLKRRLVKAWAEKFGVAAQDYPKILQAIETADVMDLFKGGVIETGQQSTLTNKAALCIATFASALARDNYSLLTIKDQTAKDQTAQKDNPDRHLPTPDDNDRFTEADVQRTSERQLIFEEYLAVLPEQALGIAELLLKSDPHYFLQRVPFVNDKPSPAFTFQGTLLPQTAYEKLKKWDGKKSFVDFMQAMGLEEAVVFYENLLIEKGQVATYLISKLEEIFIPGIGVLLQEKGVPLHRCKVVEHGMKTMLEFLPDNARAKVWARILAGIACQNPMGEILREAIKPLGIAGGKLMQVIHSAVTGVDATLEEATRLSLDQTSNFSLLDSLKFLGFRLEDGPFSRAAEFKTLGQGTVRVGVAGGPAAFLLVHSRPTPPEIVNSLTRFIQSMGQSGHFLPLDAKQFAGLVKGAQEEVLSGFRNHARFGAFHHWKLGDVNIPRIMEEYPDWAVLELVEGVPLSSLPQEEQAAAAEKIIAASLAQFDRPTPKGTFLVNPEVHLGNTLFDRQGGGHLIDCGLIGEVTSADFSVLPSLFSAYKQHHLPGAVASLLVANGLTSVSSIPLERLASFKTSLRTISLQLTSGIAPEFLLTSLSGSLTRDRLFNETEGLGTLLRGLQHLAPYIRLVPTPPTDLLAAFAGDDPKLGAFAAEIKALFAEQQGPKKSKALIPAGVEVGNFLGKDRGIQTLGILTRDSHALTEETCSGNQLLVGIFKFEVGDGVTYGVPPRFIRIRHQGQWLTLEEWVSV